MRTREHAWRHASVEPPIAWKRYGGTALLLPAEVVTWKTQFDGQGRPFTGIYPYLLRFERGQEPPAHGFWSLTLYNRVYLPVDNPIHRYAIGDRDDLTCGEDGSLEIYIQHRPPRSAVRCNWLPAPLDEFLLELSIYSPRPDVIEEGWQPPAIRRVELEQ
jgi:hypothetical protein